MYFFRWICQFNLRSTALRFIVKLEGSQGARQMGTRLIPCQTENWSVWGHLEDPLAVVSGLHAVGGQREQVCSEWITGW